MHLPHPARFLEEQPELSPPHDGWQGVLVQVSRKADAIPATSITKAELEAMLESTLKLACKQHSKAVAAGAAAALQTLLALALSGKIPTEFVQTCMAERCLHSN